MSNPFADEPTGDEPVEPVPMDETVAPEAEAEAEVISEEFDELVTLMNERDEARDQLLRARADFENYRKRMQREALEARDAGAASLAAKLVDVLDVVDYALGHDPSDAVAQISAKLDEVLVKEGLVRIDAFGAAFDPERHDAVLHEEGDGPAEVIEVLRSGWLWREKVLRAAMVKVKGN